MYIPDVAAFPLLDPKATPIYIYIYMYTYLYINKYIYMYIYIYIYILNTYLPDVAALPLLDPKATPNTGTVQSSITTAGTYNYIHIYI
jgi:hypothetical protein